MKKNRDPLRPLEFIVTAIGVLIIAAVVVGAVAAVVGNGSVFGFGDSDVCVAAPTNGLGTTELGKFHGRDVMGLHPGISAVPQVVTLCRQGASTREHLLYGGSELASFAFLMGFLVMTWWVIQVARGRGLFTLAVARRLTLLGVYLLVGGVIAATVQAVLLHALIGGFSERDATLSSLFSMSWATLIAGFGLLTLGRVMRHGVVLQQEIDTLV